MRRGVFDALRRGLDNAIANWPLILLRLAEAIVFGILVVITVIAVLLPIVVSIGIQFSDMQTPEDLASAAELLMSKWLLLTWIFIAISALLIVFVAIHSFVEAGCARVLIDGERIAGPEIDAPRSRFRVFSIQRWMAGAASGWWSLFWIYNGAWGVAGLILLIPLLPTLIIVLLARENPPAAAMVGCAGLVATVLLGIVVGIVTSMWTTRAIVSWAAHRRGAGEALSSGWRAVRKDLGRHLGIAIGIIVVGVAGSMFFASFSFFAGFGEVFSDSTVFTLITFPLRIVGSILSSIFSAGVSSWYLAAYAVLATEER